MYDFMIKKGLKQRQQDKKQKARTDRGTQETQERQDNSQGLITGLITRVSQKRCQKKNEDRK